MSVLSVLFYLYVAFIGLVFIGMLAIDIAPYLKKKEDADYKSSYRPKALVMVPCKGIDLTLAQNLKALSGQNYRNYDVVGIVDSTDDPAADYIHKAGIKLLVSDYKAKRSSKKVLALLTAMKKLPSYDVYVIADSDVLVKSNWLSALVRPLSDNKIGLSTTYPRFTPVAGFWSKVKFLWGFVGEGMMENKVTRFGWGGSLAFRKGFIDAKALDMLKNSKYAVSDDICLSKTAKRRGLGLAYVSSVQPIVNSDDSFSRFIEWSNRQTALVFLASKKYFYFGIAFYAAEVLLFLSGILMSYFISPVFLLFLLHFVKSEAKTYSRARLADPAIALIVAMLPFMYLISTIVASRMSYITWRGNRYELS